MFKHESIRRRTSTVALGIAAVAAVALAGCSTGGGPAPTEEPVVPTYSQADLETALQEETTLTMWGWAAQTELVIDAFEKGSTP